MANSLYQQMSRTTNNNLQNNIQSIKNIANMLSGQSNPMQILQNMAMSNPQVSQVMNMVNGSGMTAKQLFNQMANQNGVNPNDIINMLK